MFSTGMLTKDFLVILSIRKGRAWELSIMGVGRERTFAVWVGPVRIISLDPGSFPLSLPYWVMYASISHSS